MMTKTQTLDEMPGQELIELAKTLREMGPSQREENGVQEFYHDVVEECFRRAELNLGAS